MFDQPLTGPGHLVVEKKGVALERVLRRTQAIAGTLFAVFVLLHIANVLLAPFGAETFNAVQQTLRALYQYPLIEAGLVVGPLIVHLVASLWLWRRSAPRRARRPWRARLHTWSGVFLLIVIFGHIAAVRGPSFVYGIYPEFQGIAFSLWLAPWYFYPYYLLLSLAGFYHATGGLMTLARRKGWRLHPHVHTIATGVVGILTLVALLSFGGVLTDEPLAPWDNDFARLGAELFGIELPLR